MTFPADEEVAKKPEVAKKQEVAKKPEVAKKHEVIVPEVQQAVANKIGKILSLKNIKVI